MWSTANPGWAEDKPWAQTCGLLRKEREARGRAVVDSDTVSPGPEKVRRALAQNRFQLVKGKCSRVHSSGSPWCVPVGV